MNATPHGRDNENAASPMVRALGCALALATVVAVLFVAVRGPVSTPPPSSDETVCAPGVDLIGFSDALDKARFEGTNVGGLSALASGGDTYRALVDNEGLTPARFYTLRLPVERGGLGDPKLLDATILRDATGTPFTGTNFDGEGMAAEDGEVLISSETEPSIRRFSRDGRFLEELPVPSKFLVGPRGEAEANQTFESLSLTDDGRSLFTAVEGPLAPDGETADGEARIRILRYEKGESGFEPQEEYFYLAEPGGQGVADIVALAPDGLLVLERGFVEGEGNTVRVFLASLDGAEDISGERGLAGHRPVEKDLLFDLADCPPSGAKSPGDQRNPLLDNFEAMTLGGTLPGGEQTLLLASDDNFSEGQVTRVVALGVVPRR